MSKGLTMGKKSKMKEITTTPVPAPIIVQPEIPQEAQTLYKCVEDFIIDLEKAVDDGTDLTINLTNVFMMFAREIRTLKHMK
jgi:hypothetical protein